MTSKAALPTSAPPLSNGDIMALLKVVERLPEWLSSVANDAMLSAKEVAEIFCLKDLSSVHTAVNLGSLPKPDKKAKGFNGVWRLYWRKSTILKAFNFRQHYAKQYPKNVEVVNRPISNKHRNTDT